MRKFIALVSLALALAAGASPSYAAGKKAPVELVHTMQIMAHGYRQTRTVEETELITGRLVHFMALSRAADQKLPKWMDIASVDGSPYEPVAFPDTSMMVADANQNTGSFPGVVGLTAGSSNIVVGGTAANPTVDLATGITLSNGTAIQLTGAATNIIQSSGLTIGYDLTMPSGTPTDVLVVNPTNSPSGKLARFQIGGTDKLTIDASGNLVTTGNISAVNGTFTGTLGVTGTSTLGTVNAGQVNSSTLTASNCVGSDGSKNLVSNSNCVQSLTAGSNVVSSGISGSTPTVAVTAAPSFAGSVTSVGTTNSANATYSQSVSTNTNSTAFPPFTSFTDTSLTITAGTSTQVTLSSGTNATNGIVVGAVLKADTGTIANQETITVTATTGGAGNQFTAFYVNGHTGSITYLPTLLPVTVTPASMTGITTGQLLYVDTGSNLDEVPVISTNSTQFVGLFSKTHATGSIAIAAGAAVACTPTAAGCTQYSAATGATGGWVYTAPNIQGADGNEQGIVTIVVPTNGNGASNVPYDLNFEGGQNGDLGKTSHTLTFNCLAANQDCVMFLDQGDTSGGANQKCFTFNTGGGGSTSTPSLVIVKCDGSLASVTGNIQATSSSNGKGGIYTGDSGNQYGANAFVSGAFGNGALGIGGTGPFVVGTVCAVTMPNAGTSTALTNNVGCTITTGSANTASAFIFTFVQTWNTAPIPFVQCGTACVSGSSILIPVVSSLTTGGFTVTWVNSSGTATALGNTKTFYIYFCCGK